MAVTACCLHKLSVPLARLRPPALPEIGTEYVVLRSTVLVLLLYFVHIYFTMCYAWGPFQKPHGIYVTTAAGTRSCSQAVKSPK